MSTQSETYVPPPRPELSRPVPVMRASAGMSVTVEATPVEAEAVARRMGLPAIHALRCTYNLRGGPGGSIAAAGRLRARLRQICVLTLEPFDADLAEDFTLRFVPEGSESDGFDPLGEDEITFSGETIDLGEATSEQLALALDPFPRAPGAALPDAPEPDTVHPFAALSRLRSEH